jgi:hypothetical protein
MMRLEEARGFVMQALRQGGWNQALTLIIAVGDLKAKAEGRARHPGADGRQFIDSHDQRLLLEIIWSLIIQGILVPGLDDHSKSWPFLRLTEYGSRCVKEDRILPHDPDGYLREFKLEIPRADPTITEYLAESLQCFIHGLNRAAAVMLGGASEMAVILLVDSYSNSIADTARRQRFESDIQKASSIFRKYELFEKQFAAIKNLLPKVLSDNVDSLLRGVFDLIRNSRNEGGHPASGTLVDRDVVYSHLRLFNPYCRRIYGLIEWFENNKT